MQHTHIYIYTYFLLQYLKSVASKLYETSGNKRSRSTDWFKPSIHIYIFDNVNIYIDIINYIKNIKYINNMHLLIMSGETATTSILSKSYETNQQHVYYSYTEQVGENMWGTFLLQMRKLSRWRRISGPGQCSYIESSLQVESREHFFFILKRKICSGFALSPEKHPKMLARKLSTHALLFVSLTDQQKTRFEPFMILFYFPHYLICKAYLFSL